MIGSIPLIYDYRDVVIRITTASRHMTFGYLAWMLEGWLQMVAKILVLAGKDSPAGAEP